MTKIMRSRFLNGVVMLAHMLVPLVGSLECFWTMVARFGLSEMLFFDVSREGMFI
jgi:hypothetical protein